MKKKIVATLLLSTIALTSFGSVVSVKANDTDSQIAAQDSLINEIAAKQAAAQAEVDAIQAQVDTIRAEQERLTAENERLEAESQRLIAEIEQLTADIISRDGALKEQARSAQTDGSASSYINTILDSKSIVDAVSRVNAMREIVSANNRMLEQQKADKEALAKKQEENQEAINTVWNNQQKLAEDQKALEAQEAALQVAQLNLAAEKATAEDTKANLLAQKAAAEAAARQAAARQAAYEEEQRRIQEAQQQPVTPVAPETSVASTPSTPAASTPSTSVASTPSTPVTTTPITYSSAGNTYPVGQCTWGAKQAAPWVGNYWGNAGQWLGSARAAGFSTGSTPRVGAVAVWTNSYYGHVAVVTAVNGSQIQVVESNYAGNMSVGNHRGWFNPAADGVAGYIYP